MTWGNAQPAPFHKHVITLNRGATSLANQATLSSAVFMLVKWSWLCITQRHERNLFFFFFFFFFFFKSATHPNAVEPSLGYEDRQKRRRPNHSPSGPRDIRSTVKASLSWIPPRPRGCPRETPQSASPHWTSRFGRGLTR